MMAACEGCGAGEGLAADSRFSLRTGTAEERSVLSGQTPEDQKILQEHPEKPLDSPLVAFDEK